MHGEVGTFLGVLEDLDEDSIDDDNYNEWRVINKDAPVQDETLTAS